MVKLVLPDESELEVSKGCTCLEAIKKISEGLARDSLIAKLDGKLVDLKTPIEEGGEFEALTFDSQEGKETFRHSSSHIMALAVKRLFPDVKFGIGPAIEDGFYYDLDIKGSFKPGDLERIEEEMRKIVKEELPFERREVSRQEALKVFKDQPYKIELIKELPDTATISLYKLGEFTDLCRGPHVPHSGYIKAFKLQKIAGAYWKGDSDNKMLQRIYGTSFPSKKQLKKHLKVLEEAKKRDHRKLGKKLDLFSFQEEAPGMPFWHPKGVILWNTLINFWREEHRKRNYKEIKTPMILNKDLWVQSGHWDHYKDNMYFTKIDDQDYAIKPMNCPGGMLVYKRKTWSYRDLPSRVGELGLVHRHELSGVLSGLLRVRCFTQDDAHIFMTEDQMIDETIELLKFIDYFYSDVFGFDYHVELSTKPDDSMGGQEIWDKAESVLKKAMEKLGWDYKINPGDGAFYGPKLDFKLKDAIGRSWQCGTVQLDFLTPEKFDLTYVGEDGEEHRPIMLHRVIYGSLERFIAVLIEHYAGKFPVWLSPEQVRVITITDRQNDYAKKVYARLKEEGIRTKLDKSQNTLQYKIREAQVQKIPYMLIIGDKEEEAGTVAIRTREEEKEFGVKLDDFIGRVKKDIIQFE